MGTTNSFIPPKTTELLTLNAFIAAHGRWWDDDRRRNLDEEMVILLMEGILHHLECIKPWK